MTIGELKQTLLSANKGLAYGMYRQAILVGQVMNGKLPVKIDEALPELFPPKKTYKMPEWLKERYAKQMRERG